MEVIELRIGNYYKCYSSTNNYEGFFTVKLTKEILQSYLNGDSDYEYFEPIPLTQEWLVKFGAKETNRHWFTYSYKDIEISHNIENGVVNLFSNKNSEEPIIIKGIYSVHTFQNLVFSLTGEDLVFS